MTNLTLKIEERLAENKSSVKTYASHAFANSKGEQMSKAVGGDFTLQFITIFLPKTKRWTVVFQQSVWMKINKVGGYVGFIADKGYFTI